MANDKSKVERLGLEQQVQSLMAQGILSGRAIAEHLRTQAGADISDSAVQRYVAKVRDEFRPAAARIFSEHQEKELPKDLKSLEDIQGQARKWWQEAPQDTADRLAAAAADIDANIQSVVGFFRTYEELRHKDVAKAQRHLVREVAKFAAGLFARDARLQDKRIAAMKMELDAIKVKLGNLGSLEDQGERGRIIIMDRSGEAAAAEQQTSADGRTQVSFPTLIPGRA